MAQKQVAKKARKPEASERRREEKNPKSPRGMPRSLAGLGGSSHSASSLSGFVMNFLDTPLEYRLMAGTAQIPLYSAAKVAQEAQVLRGDNGMC